MESCARWRKRRDATEIVGAFGYRNDDVLQFHGGDSRWSDTRVGRSDLERLLHEVQAGNRCLNRANTRRKVIEEN